MTQTSENAADTDSNTQAICQVRHHMSFVSDEIMQQEIRPLLAVDIIEQLHRQFALLSGGRGKDSAPIITFPECSGFNEVPEEDFLNVVTYLTSIPRKTPVLPTAPLFICFC
uniref:Uncharacterized protein n=1 Tax=Xiphophorus couchianus TaxID=32473 RepID=A0A3B5LV36_9TELE